MIQLELSPEVEQQVVEAARARSLEPTDYASQIVADSVAHLGRKRLSQEEFRAAMDRSAATGANLPRLPEYAYTRESFNEDHD